jgi:hypothetical protein
MHISLALVPLAAVAVAACSSSSSGGSPNPGGDGGSDAGSSGADAGPGDAGASSGECTFTLNGAVTISGSCTARATLSIRINSLDFTLDDADGDALSFALEPGTSSWTGGTYTYAQAKGAFAHHVDPPRSWEMSKGDNGDGEPSQGDFTLTVTDPGEPTGYDETTVWTPHGTLSLTMPALARTGAPGTVTATATF